MHHNMIKHQLRKGIRLLALALVFVMGIGLWAPQVSANKLRLKDLIHIKGVRNNQLVGYGVVYGLNRTGDQSRSTMNANYNLIQNMGGRLNNPNDIRSTNSAAVIVTAIVPPFAKSGDHIDVVTF